MLMVSPIYLLVVNLVTDMQQRHNEIAIDHNTLVTQYQSGITSTTRQKNLHPLEYEK